MARVGTRIMYWISREARRQVVGGGLAGGQDRLADRPAALVRQHGVAQRLGQP